MSRAQWMAGFDAATAVIEEKFFAGPTKDMVLGWLARERATTVALADAFVEKLNRSSLAGPEADMWSDNSVALPDTELTRAFAALPRPHPTAFTEDAAELQAMKHAAPRLDDDGHLIVNPTPLNTSKEADG